MNRVFGFIAVVIAVVIVLVGLGGCSDVVVPDGALVICNDDDTCPDDLVCEPTSRLCVRGLVGDELTPPAATITPLLIGSPFIAAASDVVVEVTFASAPLRAPTIILAADGVDVAAFVVGDSADDLTWRATLKTSTALPEGRLAVVVSALDGRGLPRAFNVGVVEVDTTPAVIGNVSFQRLPDPRKTPIAFDILDEEAIGPAIDVSLAFSVNERLSTTIEPTARFVGSSVPLLRDPAVENPVTFSVRWPTTPVADGSLDGNFDVEVVVVDAAGNVTSEIVVAAVEIDATPPLAPVVDEPGAVVFERAPWGRADAVGFDVYTVVGAVGVVDAGDVVIVSRDAAGAREIGRTRADDSGFGGIDRDFLLSTGDLLDVYVAVGDGAGNMSTAVAVRDTRWFASPGGKIVGNTISNPHVLEALPIFAGQLQQGGVSERGAIDGVGARDSDVLVTRGAGTFRALASDDGDVLSPVDTGLLVGATVGHDPVRNITVVFGGRVPEIPEEGPDRGFQVGCGRGVGDVVTRGADGRFRRRSFPAAVPRPPPMRGARLAFDTSRNQLLLVGLPDLGGGPQMWAFDGLLFTQLCTDAVCSTSMPEGLRDFGLAYDAGRHVLVAHGGELGAATFEFDGARWSAVCGGDVVCAAPGGTGGLVYDDRAGRILWFDGGSISAFDGAAWTALCADAACLASAPAARDNATAAWDRRRGRLVTFGGDLRDTARCSFGSQTFPRAGVPEDASRATPPTSETWEFDGTLWQQRLTPTSPPPRALHQMAWDEGAGAVLVVGGDDCACSGAVRDAGFRSGIDEDAWHFDGGDWARVDLAPAVPAGFTRTAPLPISFHSMVPSTATGGVLAHGAATGDSFLLVKEGRFYRAIAAAGGPTTFLSPLASTIGGDVFAFTDGLTPLAVRLVATTFAAIGDGPDPPFFGYSAAHDGERLVVFGGAAFLNGGQSNSFSTSATDVTRTFSSSTGLVTPCADEACGAVPGRRTRSAMSPTRNAGEVLLFGGMPNGDTWIMHDGTSWQAPPTTVAPQPRQDLLLVFDPARAAVFMTGGTDDDPIGDDRGRSAERVLPAFLDAVWEWSDEWHVVDVVDVEQDTRPSPRFGAAAAADPDGGITIYGGTPSPTRVLSNGPGLDTPRVADTWSWDGGAQRTPAQRFRVTTTAAGVRADNVITGAVVRWFGTVDGGSAPTLLIWDGGGYLELVSSSCGVGCVEGVVAQGLVQRALVGPSRELIAVARGLENGTAPHVAEVRTDFVEVAVTTRRQ